MKILTWNLGYWQHRSTHDEAWKYLCGELRADVALLQEVEPPSWIPDHGLVYESTGHGWGTAVVSAGEALSREVLSVYPGRIAAASIAVSGRESLFVASIHAPIINGRVFPHLANIIAALEARYAKESVVIGGDLNSARLAEKVWPGFGHGPFFDRIDSGEVWVDCCRKFHPMEIQTFFREYCVNPFQDDHIVVSRDLGERVRSCEVINNELTRKFSDHIPLVVELEEWP